MKRSYTYLKGLLTLALAAFTGWMWAAELVIPYSFDGKTGNTEYAYEYKVVMPSTALTSFTTTIRYSGGSHRVEILSVKLLDGETEYTAVATGTEGTEVVEEGKSYSGGNNYHNIYTFTNDAGFTANKVYTLFANLKVENPNPSHNGNIKVSGGITLDVQPFSFGVNFKTADAENISTTTGAGFAKGDYAAPINWANYTADGGNHATYTIDTTSIDVSWVARGNWNSGCSTDTDAGKLLYGYLDDVADSARTKATVTISGLPENKKYAVALVLSGDGNGDANFNNRFSPVWINNEVYAYNSEATLVKGDEAKAIQYWGSRAASAAAAGLVEGTNVMFVEGLSGGAISITSAMDNLNVSRLTIAGVQVWVTDEAAEAPAAPEDKETISLNFQSSQGSVSGEAGLVAAGGWNNLGNRGSESALNVWTGEKAVSYPMTLTYSSANGYQWTTATDAFLKGYLDDGGNHAQVSLTGIPFEEYSVIVYAATDTASVKFRSVTINGQAYIGTPGATTLGYALPVYNNTHARYGASHALTAAYGTNALRVDGLSGDLTIAGGANQYSARGGIAAIQIINTGTTLPDAQTIDWTAQPAEQLKTSELPELTNVSVQLKLAEGATLEMDSIITGHTIEIVGNNVTVNVTKLEISQAAAQAIFPDATVTTAYTETIGYTVGDVTYSLVYRGPADGWGTAANWYTGYRTNGTDTYWIPYSGSVPAIPGGNLGATLLIDGELIGEKITADDDGYKVVSAPELEGWTLHMAVRNNVHLKIASIKKLQSASDNNNTGRIGVDESSKVTITSLGTQGSNSFGGQFDILGTLTVENDFSAAGNNPGYIYTLGTAGLVQYAGLSAGRTHSVQSVILNLGDSSLSGREIVSRKLVGFTSEASQTFTYVAEGVATSVDTVTPEAADILQNVGQYKFEKKADGYYVDYVAYAETDEIGAMNTWTGTVDGNWTTAGNWSSGSVPAEGADGAISITADTTITIPAEGVSVGTLLVSGEGTLTIAGGKITATKILANTSIAADEDTLALSEMDIAEGKTVTYTTTTTVVDPDTFGSAHALALKALTGEGTLVKKGSGVIGLFATAAEPAIVIEEGAIYVREAPTTAMNIAAKAGAEIRLAAWHVDFANAANKITLDGGAQLTLANGANVSGTITIANAAETAAKICGSSFNAATIAAAITGAGKVEFADGGAFNPTSGADNELPCQYATTYSGVISGDLQVIISDTSAVTFTGANTYTGGTVIAEGVTFSITNTNALGTGAVTGAGTLVCTGVLPPATAALNDTAWTGTVKVQDFTGGTGTGAAELNLDAYGNANSVVELANVAGWVGNGTVVENLKLSGSFSQNNGSTTTAAKVTIKKLSGAGNFNGPSGSDWKYGFIVNDCSEFTGSVNLRSGGHGGQIGLIIGTEPADYAHANYKTHITVMADGVATLAAGATWTPATGSSGTVRVYGTIGGEGTIGSTLTFNAGSIINGAVTATGNVTLNGAVTVSGEAGATVLTCANAESLDLTKFTAPEGLKCIAEDGAVKLAVAKKTNFVVTVGEETVNCETVAEALGALATGGSLQIAADADAEALALTETLTIAADTTIDLNGKSLTSTADPAIHVTGGTLTLTGEGSITAPGVVIQQGTKNAGLTTKVIVDEDVLLTSFRTEGEDYDGDNVVLLYGKATLESAGVLLTYSKGYAAIQGSGGDAGAETTITITGGQVVNYNDVAIYQPQKGTLTITGGVISGSTAIYAKAGTISISGGEISGTGAQCAYGENHNGCGSTGDALVIDETAGYADLSVSITGGAFTSDNAEAVASYAGAGETAVTGVVKADATATFSSDVSDLCEAGYKTEANDEGIYGVVEDPAYGMVAQVGDTYYATLAEAYAAGSEITLIADVEGPGLVINKNVTIDFGEFSYTFTEGVGSGSLTSNGFQILKGNTVTLKNGTLKIADAAKEKFYTVIQNYADLTLVNMTIDGTNTDKWSATDGDSYALSINSGTVSIDAESAIIANNDGDKAYAFDVCKYASYDAPVVTVADGANIEGNVELSGGTLEGGASLTVESGVEGYKAVYDATEGWILKKIITLPDALVDSPAAEAIKAAMEAVGVAEITECIIVTKDAGADAPAEVVANVLEVFEVTPTVDANGVLTVTYEFGISKMTKSGDTITITAGVTGAEYREGVTVGFYADGEEVIGTATTGADSTEVSITADAANLDGKKITVKATK